MSGTGQAKEPAGRSRTSLTGQQLLVKDRHGDTVGLTAGVLDREASYVFNAGQCLALAIALSERTGWPLYLRVGHGIIGRRRKACDYAIHAMVRKPDGKLLDVDGIRDEGDWVPSGWEIDPVIIPATDARSALTRYTAGMVTQDITVAEQFVDVVLERAETPRRRPLVDLRNPF